MATGISNSHDQKAFPLQIFQSYENLRQYFQKSPDIEKITALSKSLPSLQLKVQTVRHMHFSSKSDDKELKSVISTLNQTYYPVRDLENTQLYLIQKMKNRPNEQGLTLEKANPIHAQDLDRKVRKRVYCPVTFNHRDGICSGECDWFGYLYLKTKQHFPDPRAHLFVIAALFKDGGGVEATLLQNIRLLKGKMLGLKVGAQPVHSPDPVPFPLMTKTVNAWKQHSKAIIQSLQQLKPGIFRTDVPEHSTLYIKINSSLGFYMDPNEGVIEINGTEQGMFLHALMQYSFLAVKGDPKKVFSVTPITLRI